MIGIAQRGRNGSDHVVYKPYLDHDYRGCGLGPALIESILQNLPSNAPRLCVAHFARNERAGAFYEREGCIDARVERSDANSALDVVWRVRISDRELT